jgi:hypothetical protein
MLFHTIEFLWFMVALLLVLFVVPRVAIAGVLLLEIEHYRKSVV